MLVQIYLKNHIQVFTPRIERFSNYFFPFCAPSPAAFKNAYKKGFITLKIGYFGIQDKFGVRFLTKIRVDCSDLRDHRFNHGFVNCPNPLCRCGLEDETSEHFLMRCPNYSL